MGTLRHMEIVTLSCVVILAFRVHMAKSWAPLLGRSIGWKPALGGDWQSGGKITTTFAADIVQTNDSNLVDISKIVVYVSCNCNGTVL